MTELIDTTEMYLRTIFELEEEGITPLRARIAERLNHSGPTVSQTVSRMERDGLLHVETDRHLALTDEGRLLATRVMRKHRLAEKLLTDVIGLQWEIVHDEACRWEHVMSVEVEERLVEILDHPTESPYGNPIPGLAELGAAPEPEPFLHDVQPLTVVAGSEPCTVQLVRIGEQVQKETATMNEMRRVGARPGATVSVVNGAMGVLVSTDAGSVDVDEVSAGCLFVRPAKA